MIFGRRKPSEPPTGGTWLIRNDPLMPPHHCTGPRDWPPGIGPGSEWACGVCGAIWELRGNPLTMEGGRWERTARRLKDMG